MAVKRNYIVIMLLLITILLVGSVAYLYVFNSQNEVKEGFQATRERTPIISLCPRWAPEIQSTKGTTDCCEGDAVDGKCNGTTFCTLSPAYGDVPTCIEAWRKYFLEKSQKTCPTSMPHYYEDIKGEFGKRKGCSFAKVNKNGDAPQNWNANRCTIYEKESDNREKKDSCYVEKLRLQTKCPSVDGERGNPVTFADGNRFQYIQCYYRRNTLPGFIQFCIDDTTGTAYYDRRFPNWRQTAFVEYSRALCSKYQEEKNAFKARTAAADEERRKRQEAERQARLAKQREEEERRRREKAEADLKAAREAAAKAVKIACPEATFYENGNYRGRSFKKLTGRYANATESGIPNNLISSIKVGPGTRVRLYTQPNFQGQSVSITRDIAILPRQLNDKMASFIVEAA